MFTATMSTKGQITLPKEIREELKLHAGTKIQGTVDSKGRLILVPATYEPEELFEGRPAVKRKLSVAQMEEAIRKGATRGRF